MDVIATSHPSARLWGRLLGQVRTLLAARGAHPSRTAVLLPFAQLMPLARQSWIAAMPDGFAPHFETSMNWAGRLAGAPGPEDVSFDMGRDLLTARAWLDRAGLGERAALLASRLVEAAWQAAPAAAAVPPAERAAWAAKARPAVSAGLDVPALALEAALARIALEWAAASRYLADALMADDVLASIDLLVVCQGFESDPLAATLARLWGDRAVLLPLEPAAPRGQQRVHEAADPSQEAEMAAACVVRHLQAGHAPVALAAVDRVLTRRIRALLDVHGVAVRDETGWKLSTTRAAAQVMAGLRACARSASSDAVIDWLKHVPSVPPGTTQAIERRVRRAGLRDWTDVDPRRLEGAAGRWSEALALCNAWREALHRPRTLVQWQEALRKLLADTLAWPALQADAAGAQVLESLGLLDVQRAEWDALPHAARRLSLGEFSAWCNEVLESASFIPVAPEQARVVVLPLNQLLARPFMAVVVPGCDELRLVASPEPPGHWTAAQRLALGLPTREALEQERRAAWAHLLQAPHADLLWRRSEQGGEPLLPSPLLQALLADGSAVAAQDPRGARACVPRPVPRPLPARADLRVDPISASAYEDLRRCPYRFFALRQLGLQEAAETDEELGKRDFGTWLHQVLRDFHRDLQAEPGADREALIDRCAADATRQLALPPGEFLPFAAGWPQVRKGYLAWVREHEARGVQFAAAEEDKVRPLGPVQIKGRIDRVDQLADGRRLVIDYKTESLQATRDRVQTPFEDTQLAFYAALLEDDTLEAAYVNISERGVVTRVDQRSIVEARDALVEGLLQDLDAIEGGASLPALGEGQACEFCAARGLCRRDHWHG